MNPLLEKQFESLEKTAEQLAEAVQSARTTAKRAEEDLAKATTDTWTLKKELASLRPETDELESLTRENVRLKELNDEAKDRLRGLLKKVRGLSAYLGPEA